MPGPRATAGSRAIHLSTHQHGVYLDQQSTFGPHFDYIDRRCARPLRPGRLPLGALDPRQTTDLRRLHCPHRHLTLPRTRGRSALHDAQVRRLMAVQRAAGHSILDCFRTTSTAAVDTELHLTPIPIALIC
ncbi:hypothetical protein BDV06DRAFT_116145 [Aspergillus oleicola]